MERAIKPKVGHNDVLIQIHATAICGTDIHIYNWDPWSRETIPVPMTIGHEFAGEIVDVGGEVQGFEIGERVSGEGHITCGHCRNCRAGRRHLCRNTVGVGVNRPGCFAEYLSIPAVNAFHLPEEIPDEIGAILDPLGNATHTALSFDMVGEDVLITGAGPIGIMATAIARHVGARFVVVTDVNDYRLELAAKMGATRTLNVTRESLDGVMAELGMTEGFDVGLEMSGNLQAHLRPRNVRDLVQDDDHAPKRPGHRADRHPPPADRRLPGGLRDHEFGPVRQGDFGLDRIAPGPTCRRCRSRPLRGRRWSARRAGPGARARPRPRPRR
jgi:L-threonine 3-dehydrogenase